MVRSLLKVLGLELQVQRSLVRSFFPRVIFAALIAVVALVAIVLAIARQRAGSSAPSPVLRAAITLIAVSVAALPVSRFLVGLVPWWRADQPGLALPFTVLGLMFAIAVLSIVGPWRQGLTGPPCVVLAITSYVVALDTVFGSRLQLTSMRWPATALRIPLLRHGQRRIRHAQAWSAVGTRAELLRRVRPCWASDMVPMMIRPPT